MSALAAAAIGSVALGAYKAIDGANQKADAKKLAASNKFTPEQLPGEVQLATNLAAQNYYNGMPGTQRAQQLIGQNGANAFYNGSQGASSGADLLDLAARINQGQNVATNDLVAQGAQYKAQALGGYQNALSNQASWQDKLYQNNVLNPYNAKANTASAMYGAGQQNMFSGLDQIGTAGLGYAQGKAADARGNYNPYATAGERNGTYDLPSANMTYSGYTGPNLAAAMAVSQSKKGY
jgi:hypothetical protein